MSVARGAAIGSRNTSQSRPWRRRSCRLFLLGFAFLALLEGGPRLLFHEQLKILTPPDIYVVDSNLGYRYRPGAVSRISVPSICKEVRINANGYYGHAFALEKDPATFRIAIVGGSNASGIWMDGERTFAVELQRLFREAGRDVEILNFGVDGSVRSLASLRLINEDVLRYRPDLVLLELDVPIRLGVIYRETYRGYAYEPGNSMVSRAETDTTRTMIHEHVDELERMFVARVYRLSYFLRAIHRGLLRIPRLTGSLGSQDLLVRLQEYKTRRIRVAHSLPCLDIAASLRCLRQTRGSVEESGGSLLMFSYGNAPEIEGQLKNIGIPCLSLGLSPDRALRHKHDGHFNELGHRRIAEDLFRLLTERGYPR